MEQSKKTLSQRSGSDEEKKPNERKPKKSPERQRHLCEFCHATFTTIYSLNRHKKNLHLTADTLVREGGKPKKEGKVDITNEIPIFNPLDLAYSQSEQKKGTLTEFGEPIQTHNKDLFTNEMEPNNNQSNFKQSNIQAKRKRRTFQRIQGLYKCEFCSKRYSSFKDLSLHLKGKHKASKEYEKEGDDTYFNNQERKGTVTEFKEPIMKAFEELCLKAPSNVGKETIKNIHGHLS